MMKYGTLEAPKRREFWAASHPFARQYLAMKVHESKADAIKFGSVGDIIEHFVALDDSEVVVERELIQDVIMRLVHYRFETVSDTARINTGKCIDKLKAALEGK